MRLAVLLIAAVLAALSYAAASHGQTPAAPAAPAEQSSTPPWPPGTGAPPNPANQAVAQACRGDIQKLCAGLQPGGGRILQCFKAHATDISPDCKAALSQMQAASGGGGRFRRRDGSVPN